MDSYVYLYIQTPARGRQGGSAEGSHDSRRMDLSFHLYTPLHIFICICTYSNTSIRKARRFWRNLAWLEKNGPQLPSTHSLSLSLHQDTQTHTPLSLWLYLFNLTRRVYLSKHKGVCICVTIWEEWTSASEYVCSLSLVYVASIYKQMKIPMYINTKHASRMDLSFRVSLLFLTKRRT